MYLIDLDVFGSNIFGVVTVLKAIYFHCVWKRFSKALKMATGEREFPTKIKNRDSFKILETQSNINIKFSNQYGLIYPQ